MFTEVLAGGASCGVSGLSRRAGEPGVPVRVLPHREGKHASLSALPAPHPAVLGCRGLVVRVFVLALDALLSKIGVGPLKW